ncbi:tyrosine-type recombinase/integrase [Klebsiella pneumoniae]|uniref:tyrosine-type recombinase/integrase n=1 Tax=Klebsiella pneumoniae TaxID=573 RepID=UPI000B409147|nr:site-specific integrase [Klebsiella pneumoniae]MDF1983371.1 site-specific integrase [Klebsiella pneumoniae]OVV55745.1 recombinase XerC [Klebsiella pneumoniae]OVV67717.1 recombinase XerC [Klebsiella pneumoniae]OVV74236.1 recombinase XerC [Klebsiella pneumoniae]OVV86092.1 recombinase XerC [Klebsiella pneumoniae]
MTNKRLYNNPKYTTKRCNTFYINFRLPSGAFFRQSLGTDSLKVAEATMSRLLPFIALVQNGTMSEESFKREIRGVRKATKQDVDALQLHWLKIGAIEAETIPEVGQYHLKLTGGEEIDPDRSQQVARQYAQENLKQLYNGKTEFTGLLKYALLTQDLDVSDIGAELDKAASEITMSRALLYKAYDAFYSGDLFKFKQLTSQMVEQAEVYQRKLAAALPQPEPQLAEPKNDVGPSTPLLSDAWKMFTTEKGKGWAATIANENQRYYDVLMYVVGDLPVGSISKQHIRKTLEVIKNLPRRNKKPYSEWTLEQCIGSDVPEEDMISSANVKKHLKIYSSFFKVFLKDEKDILEKTPTEGIKYEVQENKGGHYSRPEMQRFVKRLNTFTDWRRDYFLTLIYTGARRGEIAAIRKEHIRKDEETGRYYIFIAGGKTEHAQRQIPISKTIEALLLERIQGIKPGALVFGDLPTYEQIGLEWHSMMEQCNIPKFNEFDQKRVIHACRHTFISEAIAKTQNAALVQFVVGHSRTQSLGITARYTHRPPLKDLLQIVDCIKW